MRKKVDPSAKYGRLRPTSYVPGNSKRAAKWTCQCDCGNVTEVEVANLLRGRSQSCGCLRGEGLRERSTTHGLSNSREYVAWCNIKARCLRSTSASYHNYGGRGITVCERWASPDGFGAFLADMGPAPSSKHSGERRDNNGPDSPDNCYWATRKEQARNKRNNALITFEGETLCVTDWAERYGINAMTLASRLRAGWDVRRALSTPGRRCKEKD